MQVASLELCKELYELSWWDDTDYMYFDDKSRTICTNRPPFIGSEFPAYDLGYLLDKLVEVKTGLTLYHVHSTMSWEAFFSGKSFKYGTDTQHWETQGGMNPTDALAKLAIELFKQGILTNTERKAP